MPSGGRRRQAFLPDRPETGPQQAFEEELLATLTEFQADMIVPAGFLAILSENFTRHYPERILNIHPSLIPSFAARFYGLKVHQAALDYSVKVKKGLRCILSMRFPTGKNPAAKGGGYSLRYGGDPPAAGHGQAEWCCCRKPWKWSLRN